MRVPMLSNVITIQSSLLNIVNHAQLLLQPVAQACKPLTGEISSEFRDDTALHGVK